MLTIYLLLHWLWSKLVDFLSTKKKINHQICELKPGFVDWLVQINPGNSRHCADGGSFQLHRETLTVITGEKQPFFSLPSGVKRAACDLCSTDTHDTRQAQLCGTHTHTHPFPQIQRAWGGLTDVESLSFFSEHSKHRESADVSTVWISGFRQNNFLRHEDSFSKFLTTIL